MSDFLASVKGCCRIVLIIRADSVKTSPYLTTHATSGVGAIGAAGIAPVAAPPAAVSFSACLASWSPNPLTSFNESWSSIV